MLTARVNKDEAVVHFTGNLETLVCESAMVIGRIHQILKNCNEEAANEFRLAVQITVKDDSPVWSFTDEV